MYIVYIILYHIRRLVEEEGFKIKWSCEMKANPVRETRAVYNKVHLELNKNEKTRS